jgi:hypothetical protein
LSVAGTRDVALARSPDLKDLTTSTPSDPVIGTHRRSPWIVPAALFGAYVVLVVLLYASARHAFAGDSDGATVVLQGQTMGGGNVTLHGWALSLDSFWTVDAVAYMFVEWVTGVRDALLFLVPSMIAGAVVIVGALLAKDRRRGIPGIAAAATVVVVLALPSHVLANVFLRGPLHVGTALLCLCAFAGLRRGRFGWGWIAAVLCLAAGVLGDFQTAVLGVGSVVTAGLVAMLRTRGWRGGSSEVTAALAALLTAGLVRTGAIVLGTFSVNANHPVASGSQVLTNLARVPTWGANMLGVGGGRLGSGGVPVALDAVHWVGLVVVVVAIVAAAVALVRGAIRGSSSTEETQAAWRLDDLLVLGVFADIGVFLALTTSKDPGFLRYLTAAVIFGAVLAGRWVGRVAAALPSARPTRRAAAAAALAIVALSTVAFSFTLAGATPRQPVTQLDRFLEARQLDAGIGDYWSASITTVATGGAVTVRPVISTPAGRVVRYERQSDASWYKNQRFDFLVYNTARPWGGVDASTAASTFGPAARTYAVGPYRVLVWRHPVFVRGKGRG